MQHTLPAFYMLIEMITVCHIMHVSGNNHTPFPCIAFRADYCASLIAFSFRHLFGRTLCSS